MGIKNLKNGEKSGPEPLFIHTTIQESRNIFVNWEKLGITF